MATEFRRVRFRIEDIGIHGDAKLLKKGFHELSASPAMVSVGYYQLQDILSVSLHVEPHSNRELRFSWCYKSALIYPVKYFTKKRICLCLRKLCQSFPKHISLFLSRFC